MRDYLTIASSPIEEPCAQLGQEDYAERSRAECKALIGQIRRELGEEQGNARLQTKSFPHDFGNYREVVCVYDDMDEAGQNYAYLCEEKCPMRWDEQAKQELQDAGILLTTEQ